MVPGREPQGDVVYYFADLYRDEAQVCRVGYASQPLDEDTAQRMLAKRARSWIAEYLQRSW